MVNKYTVSRNIASGNEEEYRVLRKLAEECGAIKIEDEIDLDSCEYPLGEYGKYYLNIEFAGAIPRDLFVTKAATMLHSVFGIGES